VCSERLEKMRPATSTGVPHDRSQRVKPFSSLQGIDVLVELHEGVM
jgi:hypothetical protein